MIEMIRRFLRQKFENPILAIALAVLALMVAFPIALSGDQRGFQTSILAWIVIAAGSVSKDASTGALQMILARPLRRTDYLFGRYLGVLCASGIFLVVCALLAALFAAALLPALHIPAAPISPPMLARGVIGAFLGGVLFSATLLFFSTFLPGYGDVLGYFLLGILFSVLAGLGDTLKKPWMTRAFRTAQENVLPNPNWDEILRGENPLGAATGRWVLAVAVFLLAAALIFSRREFAYGQD
ncbi:MAG TPA: hypothetical protein VGL03_02710 [Thermoanaerobaculia bacterium]